MSENPYQSNQQPQAPQGEYGSYNAPGGYVPSAPPAYGYDATPQEAKSAATLSWIFGILGILLLPIVFGPLALWQAKKAERLGASATAGKVLGWISIALLIIGIIGGIIFGISMASNPSSF